MSETTAVPLRIIVADDHPLFLDGLVALLTTDPEMTVVGSALTGTQAVNLAADLRPDVAVLDLHLPGIDGIETTRRLASAAPDTAVLILTMFDDDESVFAAIRSGARGYLLKEADHEVVLRAVRGVANGEAIFGAPIAGRLVEWWAGTRPESVLPFPQLTPRERQLLGLLAGGLGNSQIAARMGTSVKTVRNQVSSVLSKLQVHDRGQAIIKARDAGLGHTH